MLPGVQRVWGNELSHSCELPCWELESQMDSQILEHNFRGQNPLPWKVLYIIENLLKRKCIKWAHITHLDIWNTSYGQKKGRESNWQFDSQPLKVKNRPDFFTFRQHVTYHWKALDEAYNFASYLIIIQGLHVKLCASKVAGVPSVGISRFLVSG
jgi:hypothetical protein